MHFGKFVFAQIVEFILQYESEKCVKRYNGDYHARSLNSYNHLLQLIFGQLIYVALYQCIILIFSE